MKRTVLAVFVALWASAGAFSQADKDFEDLLVLLIDGKYEKCVSKATGYTEGDDTKKHPLPYLYVGMANFEMSKLEEFREDYPKALKDACKYSIKYRKKDKDLVYWEEYQNFFAELRAVLIEESENWLAEENPKKAHYNYSQMVSFDPEDMSAHFMKGYCEILLNMPTEAVKSFKIARDILDKTGDFGKLPLEKRNLLKYGLMIYSDHLVQAGSSDSAKKTLSIGYAYYDQDEAYKAKYTAIQY